MGFNSRRNTQQMMIGVLLWTLVTNRMCVTGSSIHLQTLKQSRRPYTFTKLSNYGFEVGKSTCIMFEYKGCNDAHIALMEENYNSSNKRIYEVVFGARENTRSVIRILNVGIQYKAQRYLDDVVHCKESRKFKVGWKDGNITAYRWTKPCKWEILMSWHNTWYSVNYIGVTTGLWANGEWIIFKEECHVPINRNTLWMKNVTGKDTVFSAPMFANSDVGTSLQCAIQCQRYSNCCYYTFNGEQRDCRGYSKAGPSITSVGTELWIRY